MRAGLSARHAATVMSLATALALFPWPLWDAPSHPPSSWSAIAARIRAEGTIARRGEWPAEGEVRAERSAADGARHGGPRQSRLAFIGRETHELLSLPRREGDPHDLMAHLRALATRVGLQPHGLATAQSAAPPPLLPLLQLDAMVPAFDPVAARPLHLTFMEDVRIAEAGSASLSERDPWRHPAPRQHDQIAREAGDGATGSDALQAREPPSVAQAEPEEASRSHGLPLLAPAQDVVAEADPSPVTLGLVAETGALPSRATEARALDAVAAAHLPAAQAEARGADGGSGGEARSTARRGSWPGAMSLGGPAAASRPRRAAGGSDGEGGWVPFDRLDRGP